MALARVMLVGSLGLCGCREPNPAFMPDVMSTTGDEASSTHATTTASTTATTSPETGSTSEPGTTSTTMTGSSETSEPTTDAEPIPYAPCHDQPCPRGWDECIEIDEGSWCTHPCDEPEDCEVPSTGDAEVVCAGPSGQECALDCSDGQDCPDGMTCVDVFANIVRCVWAP